jgi:DNA-binding transcriptional MerR regulator
MPTDNDLTLAELASLAAVPPRTVRYYVAQGIIPPPVQAGSASRYPAATLGRLRLVKQLQRGHLPLAEIRRRLAELTDDQVIELAEAPPTPPSGSALDYVRSLLDPAAAEASASSGASAAVGPPATGRPPAQARPLARAAPGPIVPGPAHPLSRRIAEMPGPAAGPTAGPPDRAPVAAAPVTAAVAPPRTVGAPERSQWDRIVLEPDIELHVRRPLSRIANKRVERLLTFARQLLEEDQP